MLCVYLRRDCKNKPGICSPVNITSVGKLLEEIPKDKIYLHWKGKYILGIVSRALYAANIVS